MVTYRSDELHRRHPLRVLLTGWERVRSTRRIELGSLDRTEVADQVAAILGVPPEADVADLIFDRVGRARTLGSFLTGNMAISSFQLGRWPETERLTSEGLRAAARRPRPRTRAGSLTAPGSLSLSAEAISL